jgi:hypothetical protein
MMFSLRLHGTIGRYGKINEIEVDAIYGLPTRSEVMGKYGPYTARVPRNARYYA